MEDKEYNAIRRRMWLEKHRETLPKCVECDKCIKFQGRGGKVRACMLMKQLVDGRVLTSPEWCPKRDL